MDSGYRDGFSEEHGQHQDVRMQWKWGSTVDECLYRQDQMGRHGRRKGSQRDCHCRQQTTQQSESTQDHSLWTEIHQEDL